MPTAHNMIPLCKVQFPTAFMINAAAYECGEGLIKKTLSRHGTQ